MLLTRARHEGADQGSITTRPGIRASAAAVLPSRSSSLRDGSRRTRKPQSSLRDFRASMPSFRLEVFRQHTLPRSSLPCGSYSPGYFRTVKESWSDVSELSPIQTSNSDGSTTQPLVAELQYWRSWRVILNVTIFDSPGAKLKRSNPFSSLTGLDAEPYF